jgi:malate dehydrogenase (oxaloacetate-decarboxylating)
MEGKAALLQQFVGLSAFPLVLSSRDPETIVRTVEQFAQGFGAIQLEDIESPACFEVERCLVERLEMPILHDDQHGTAVAVLAAALTASARAGFELHSARIGVVGLGAAGTAIARMLGAVTSKAILGFDPNPDGQARLRLLGGEPQADLRALMASADLVVAVTGRKGLIPANLIRRGQGIFASAIPIPRSIRRRRWRQVRPSRRTAAP